MRRLAVLSAVALLLLVGGAVPAAAQAGESIRDYDVQLAIGDDGVLTATETITYDFDGADRHGIFREVPVRFRYDDRYDRVYPLHVRSVTATPSGTPAGVKVETEGRIKRLRIGDPDKTVTGVHTYKIVYTVEGALNGFTDHDELFWNAIGTNWSVPIAQANVRVTAPAPIGQVACFAGPEGSRLPCASSTKDGAQATFSHTSLNPFDGLTVVVGFPTGAVPAPKPVLDERWSAARAFRLTPVTGTSAGLLLAAVVAALGWLGWGRGRDRRWAGSPVDVAFGNESGVEETVPLFEHVETPVEFVPPDGIRPGEVGTLIDERANPLDVTATLVDLAVRGYLRIEEIPKDGWFGKPDWRLVRVKEPEGLKRYEAELQRALFKDGDEVLLSDLKTHFASRLHKVQDALYEDATAAGWFLGRPDRVRQVWAGLGVVALILGIGVTVLAAATTHLGLIPIPLVIGGLGLLILSGRMPRRTPKGTGMLRRVHGFRRLIAESEKERARFAERANIFSEYLPYAVVFGCTDKWARTFAGLDQEQLATGGWYVSSHPFDALLFANAIDGFAVTTSGTIAAATPSSSGASGFGGGGFSGGGGGGGGGGSW